MLTPEVCLKLAPAVRRVSERQEEHGFEAPDRMAPREQVAMDLRWLDDATIRVRDPQSRKPLTPPASMSASLGRKTVSLLNCVVCIARERAQPSSVGTRAYGNLQDTISFPWREDATRGAAR